MVDSSAEQVWAAKAQLGDQQAFARIVDAYKTPVYNLAYRMLSDAGAAEDAAQETFLKVYTRLNTYDPTRKFSSWILSIASHHCIDRLRRQRGATVSMDEIQSGRWVPDDRPQPEQVTLRGERGETVRKMLDQLPEQYRLVIALRYWEELSYEEIADATDSTVSAVKSRLHRARKVMATMMTEKPEPVGRDLGEARRRETQNAVSRSF